MSERTALITGGSSGIGYELAKLMAADGYNLVLVARDLSRLTDCSRSLSGQFNIACTPLSVDLSRTDAGDMVYSAMRHRGICITTLVNSAAVGFMGNFCDRPVAELLQQVQLNVTTVTHLSRLLVPGIVSSGQGAILNIASISAFTPGPLMAVYFATKAFVLSWSLALAEELEPKGVTVTCLCPGPTDTPFLANMNLTTCDLSKFFAIANPQGVAKAGYHALKQRKRLVIPGYQNKLTVFLTQMPFPQIAAKFVHKKNTAMMLETRSTSARSNSI
jgi:short-subunit dehydrogenase